MLTIIVALKVWGEKFRGRKIHIFCDNLATVATLASGKARVPLFQACHREIVFLKAKFDFQLRVSHIQGKENRAADYLSRWHLSPIYRDKFFSEFASPLRSLQEVFIDPVLFEFSHEW